MQHQGDNRSSVRSLNPATGKVEKEFDHMSDRHLEDIFQRAGKAYRSWRHESFGDRARLLQKAAEAMRDDQKNLARLCAVEMGKRVEEGLSEVELCADILDYYARNGEEFLADQDVPAGQGRAFTSYEPVGVIFSIQPWNFPFYQMIRSAAPNMMAGNTVVMKQASNVPQCAEAMEAVFRDAGAPEGVYTNILVSGSKASELVANEYVKGVAFTGSEKAGASVAAQAGKYLKKSILELGGSDPLVIMDDADVDEAVRIAAYGRLLNCGQICVSPKRVIVPVSMAEEFTEKARALYERVKIGDPQDDETQLGPLMSAEARDKVLKQVADTVKAGARLVYGGEKLDGSGALMKPTILTGVGKGMVAYSEEIFGPVLCIYAVEGEDEAIELANDTRFGLGGSIIGKNTERATQLARRINTGMVYINQVSATRPELPFGGTKLSGYGREHGIDGIREFVNHKLIHIA